jgi:hypothetical protein
MHHLEIDLETMGKGPNAAIVEIGAVFFDVSKGIGPSFTARVSLVSSVGVGMTMDAETVLWWMQQDKSIMPFSRDGNDWSLFYALSQLSEFIASFGTGPVCVWGNGADFDNVILRSAYDACKLPAPWVFRNNRCYRTLNALHPDVVLARTTEKHRALDDAIFQARHTIEILRRYPTTMDCVPLVQP